MRKAHGVCRNMAYTRLSLLCCVIHPDRSDFATYNHQSSVDCSQRLGALVQLHKSNRCLRLCRMWFMSYSTISALTVKQYVKQRVVVGGLEAISGVVSAGLRLLLLLSPLLSLSLRCLHDFPNTHRLYDICVFGLVELTLCLHFISQSKPPKVLCIIFRNNCP